MKLKKIIAGHMLALTLVFPHVVLAEDFTFNVGVDVNNMHPDISDISVFCNTTNGPNQIGGTNTKVKVPKNGELKTTVQVKFDAFPGKNPSDADFFLCKLNLVDSEGVFGPSFPANSNFCNDVNNDFRCAKQGKKFIGVISGRIP